MRASNPLQPFVATSKGPLPIPLHMNLDQIIPPQAHFGRFELEKGANLSTPSTPRGGWLPYKTVGEILPDQWQIPGTPGSLNMSPTSIRPLQSPWNLELVGAVYKSGAGVSLSLTTPHCTFFLIDL